MSVSTPMFTVPVQLLLDHGVDVNTLDPNWSSTMLHAATVCDDVALVQTLLERGANPNIRNISRSETPLELARCFPGHANHQRIVELLLAHGAKDDLPRTE